MPFDEVDECPLCMEPLDIDDMNFFPCTCGYQICRFCWHRIRTDENSLCPACRKQYQEDPAEFKPLTDEELTSIKKERRQKDQARKQKAAENRRHLANIRVVQKNLVFVVGLSNRLADPEVLKRQEYFGKFGKILKAVINSSTAYAGAQGPSASAYITYTKPEDCLRAIQTVNNLHVDGRTLKASLGTTKYCSHFLKGTQCGKSDCMYLHELGEGEASFTKDEMQAGKHQDYEQKLVEQYLSTPTIGAANPPAAVATKSSATNSAAAAAPPEASAPKPITTTRKKTDSGTSTGSGKAKEPWPLLNKPSASGDGVANTAELSSSPVPGGASSSSDFPSVQLPGDDGRPTRRSGRSCSPRSSSCSTISNPRTPTPDIALANSPRTANTSSESAADNTLVSSMTSTVTAGTTGATLLPSLPTARRLPFSESAAISDGSQAPETMSFFTKDTVHDASRLVNPAEPEPLQLPGLSRERDSMPPVSKLADWPVATEQTFTSDDDLGFDPFLESNKGLADMLENEPVPHGFHLMHGFRAPMVRQPPPGVPPPAHLPHGGGLFSDGISSVMPSLMTSVASSTSPLPPPPPGLSSFHHYNNSPVSQHSSDSTALRGSRILGLMNLGQSSAPAPNMMPSSPVHTMPNRNMYGDPRLPPHMPPPPPHNSFNGMPNGMSDMGSFNTHDLRESLKALLPNASINFAPAASSAQQPLQQSRLRNSYIQTNSRPLNHSVSWNGSSIDDQFTDPAIVSGCLSTGRSLSPPTSQQPHWYKSIQQLTADMNGAPAKPHFPQSQHQAPNAFRPPATHSRMPFVQNLPVNPTGNGSGWPALSAHNPPPGFPSSSFRPSTAQNPQMATLES